MLQYDGMCVWVVFWANVVGVCIKSSDLLVANYRRYVCSRNE
jgi:hypothetical protein